MAIEKKMLSIDDNDFGVISDAAYIKINSVEIRGNDIWINVNGYATKDARNANKCSIYKKTEKIKMSDIKDFIKDFSEDGIKAAAYEYLKTLPFYKGVDC